MKINELFEPIDEDILLSVENAKLMVKLFTKMRTEKDPEKKGIFKKALEMAKKYSPTTVEKFIFAAMREKGFMAEDASCGATGASAVASVTAPLFTKPIKRVKTPKVKKLSEAGSSIPAKERVFNPGVEVGKRVAVKAPGYEWKLVYGIFKKIGRTGLCYVEFNKPLESNGEKVMAFPPSWLFANEQDAWPKPEYKPSTDLLPR